MKAVMAWVAFTTLLVKSTAYCGESADNRLGKAWAFEGTSGYRSFDVREYSLGLTRYDNFFSYTGGVNVTMGRLWTNRVFYGTNNSWKLDGHSVSGGYKKFFGNSFFIEASLLAEAFRAWAPADHRFEEPTPAEDFGRAQRLAFTIQSFQHIGILSLEFHVDKLSRPLL